MKNWLRRLPLIVIALAIVSFAAYAFWPRAIVVEVDSVKHDTLRVTVSEDGQTRIKEKYVVSAPLAGRLTRVTLKEGDEVIADKTVLAAIDPTDSSLLDPRARIEAEARIRAAEAALERASAEVSRTAAALELAQTELSRIRRLSGTQATSQHELDQAIAIDQMRTQENRSAQFARDIARFEVDLARAALLHSKDLNSDGSAEFRFEILAPVSGRVLRIMQESAAVVQPGTPLIEIGDPTDLEIVVDVLSSDAVTIEPGAAVVVEQWGGDEPLSGRVRLIEPSAFTKISALGVEEQRVNVIIDFVDGVDARRGLGDAFRVEANISVWEEPNVLQVPVGALFRRADSWSVFVVNDGKAKLRDVTIGRRGGLAAQVIDGLKADDRVILYPGDRVQDGSRIAPVERSASRH